MTVFDREFDTTLAQEYFEPVSCDGPPTYELVGNLLAQLATAGQPILERTCAAKMPGGTWLLGHPKTFCRFLRLALKWLCHLHMPTFMHSAFRNRRLPIQNLQLLCGLILNSFNQVSGFVLLGLIEGAYILVSDTQDC